jgi:uncharacterized protein (DUF302 family)
MYEFHTTIGLPFTQALDKVRESLMAEKFGIVSEVDVQAVFKSKIDKQIDDYRILGACNPRLAERVVDSEPNAGVLLPCNVVVRETGPASTEVVFMDPVAALAGTQTDAPKAVGQDARAMLERVVAHLAE